MKMKNLKTLGLAVVAIAFMSFTVVTDKQVKVDQSKVTWKGEKITGSHEGTITLESGTLKFDGKTLVGGTFVMDMTTINVTDLEGDGKGKLEGHLKSDDFFGVDNHKKATFEITKAKKTDAKNYEVTGDMTIKGVTEPITFNMMIDGNTAKAEVTIDRTKYGIRYGSSSFFDNLKDKAIYNDFDLNVMLKF
jgi:polyisoprenoid-binding protein YceI